MKCIDCEEPIREGERRAVIPCLRCEKPMHGECAVYSEQEDPFCEHCLAVEDGCFVDAMNIKGVEA